jgi:hypothetical protein
MFVLGWLPRSSGRGQLDGLDSQSCWELERCCSDQVDLMESSADLGHESLYS